MPVQTGGSQYPWLEDRGPTLALLIVAEDVTGTAAQTVLRAGKNSLGACPSIRFLTRKALLNNLVGS